MRLRAKVFGGLAITLAASMTVLFATPASAVAPFYHIVASNNQPFLSAANPISFASTDDAVTAVNTPFVIKFYGFAKTTIYVSTNGNIQLKAPASTAFTNTCLPSSGLSGTSLAVYWDDLSISDAGEGVFTQTYGTSPHRRFVVSGSRTN